VTREKSKQRRAAAGYSTLVHRHHNLIERPITLLLDERDDVVGMIIEGRATASAGLGLGSPLAPPRLMPSDRGADADAKAFRRFVPARSLVDRLNDPFAQIR